MCKCCERIDLYKEEETEDIVYEVYAEIVQYGFRKLKKRRVEASSLRSERFNLNFCPACGRKLGE